MKRVDFEVKLAEVRQGVVDLIKERDTLRELIRRHATGDITAKELRVLANVHPCEHEPMDVKSWPVDGGNRQTLRVCKKCGLTL